MRSPSPPEAFFIYGREYGMVINGLVISDGAGVVRYLESRLQEIKAQNKLVSGIIISTNVRNELTKACQRIAGKTYDSAETVNRFLGVMLIEDGESRDRLEVVYGPKVVPPVEVNPFTGRAL